MSELTKEYEAELRRTINPQYAQQRGTESFERRVLLAEIDGLREALIEIRGRIKGHPAYADLTEEEEMNVGGDTAELSYLVRIANRALEK